jgi:hypothetical protein
MIVAASLGEIGTGAVLIAGLIFLLVMLALREVQCWYWKINKMVSGIDDVRRQLSKNNKLLDKLVKNTKPLARIDDRLSDTNKALEEQSSISTQVADSLKKAPGRETAGPTCSKCQYINDGGVKFCQKCGNKL